MRTLKDYILLKEDSSDIKTIHLEDVKVVYDGPIEYYIQAPINYSESDLMIYIEDALLPILPGAQDNAYKYFGMNASSISNTYIEYDSLTMSQGNAPRIDLEWDSRFGADTDEELVVFQIKNIKYVIEFDKFDLQNVTDENYNEKLESIFMASVPTDGNLPIRVSLNPSNIFATKI